MRFCDCTAARAARPSCASSSLVSRLPDPEVVVSVPSFAADIADVARARAHRRGASSRTAAPVRSARDHVLRAGPHEDRPVGRVAAPRAAARRRRGRRSPTSASPTCSCSRRSWGRTAAARWSSPRCARRPARPSTRWTSSGAVVDEVARPLVVAAFRTGESSRATRRCSGRPSAPTCSASRCAHAGDVVAVVTRETRPTLGRQLGELEHHYLSVFDRFARDDRRGHASRSARTTTSSRTPRASATA